MAQFGSGDAPPVRAGDPSGGCLFVSSLSVSVVVADTVAATWCNLPEPSGLLD